MSADATEKKHGGSETYNTPEIPRIGLGPLRAVVLEGLDTGHAVGAAHDDVVLLVHTVSFGERGTGERTRKIQILRGARSPRCY